MKFIIIVVSLSSLISTAAWSESRSGLSLAYPELQVSPRASERILMEARTEAKTRKTQLLPLQISALSTLLAGASAPKPLDPDKRDRDDVKFSRSLAIGVGVSWLAFSYFLNEDYTPYLKAQSILKSMPDKTVQEELVRERMAEEQIEAASSLGKKMMWASVTTNLAASIYLAGNTSSEGNIYAAAAALLSFTPLVFRDRWQTVHCYHQDYKKRIYGPLALPTLLQAPTADGKGDGSAHLAFVPGVNWQMSF